MPVAPITAVVVVDFSGQPTGQPIVLASAVARNFIFGQWDLAPFFAGAGPEKNIVGFTPSTRMLDGRGMVVIPTDQLPRTADQGIAATPNDVGSRASYICSLIVTDPLASEHYGHRS